MEKSICSNQLFIDPVCLMRVTPGEKGFGLEIVVMIGPFGAVAVPIGPVGKSKY